MNRETEEELSDLGGSDLYDSDDYPEFNVEEFGKRMKGQLSDSEEELINSIVKKRRVCSEVSGKKVFQSEFERVPQTETSTSQTEIDSASRDEEEENDNFDGTTDEEEQEAEELDWNKCKDMCLSVLNKAFRQAKGNRKAALKTSIEQLILQQTPAEVEEECSIEIERLKNSIAELENEKAEKIQKCKYFWTLQVKSLPKSGKVSARVRAGKLGGRRPLTCPLAHCHAAVKNLSRHLGQVHHIQGAEREQLKAIHRQEKANEASARAPVKPNIVEKVCCICSKALRRVDAHLVAVHGLKRGSAKFKTVLETCTETEVEGDQECHDEASQARSPETRLASATDPVRLFLSLFSDYLKNASPLGPTSIQFTVRALGDILKYSLEGKSDDEIDGMALVAIFTSFGSSASFLKRRGGNLSGGYCGKLILSCLRALAFLKDPRTPKRWAINASVADATEGYLKNQQKRYQRIEKQERALSRERKEANVLTPNEILRIIQAPQVRGVIEKAVKSLEDESLRCLSSREFNKLRDALITSMIIRSVRRAQELTEFTIGEWKAMKSYNKEGEQEGEKEYIIRVKKHKTMMYGSAEMILSETEEKALRGYMLYGRTLISPCQKDSCPVFICNSSPSPAECCIKLPLSNVSAILRKVALAAGVSTRNVNSRLLRRSTISSAWKRNSDPAFRQELSQLAGHSYETARRYYATYDASEQSRRVVKKLDHYRQLCSAQNVSEEEEEEAGLEPPEIEARPEQESRHSQNELAEPVADDDPVFLKAAADAAEGASHWNEADEVEDAAPVQTAANDGKSKVNQAAEDATTSQTNLPATLMKPEGDSSEAAAGDWNEDGKASPEAQSFVLPLLRKRLVFEAGHTSKTNVPAGRHSSEAAESTPTKSLVSVVSSKPLSFASDISGLDEDGEEVELMASEFYKIVRKERDKLKAESSSHGFRWTELKKALEKCHPYFQVQSLAQIRNRFKYVKKELSKVLGD